jgi:hypothetical protein
MHFLGVVTFLKRFIPRFADKAMGFYACLKKPDDAPKGPMTRKQRNSKLTWTESANNSFELLKEAVAKSVMLMLPDPSLPFIITCDASSVAMGAILSQVYEGTPEECALATKEGGSRVLALDPDNCDITVRVSDTAVHDNNDEIAPLEPGVEYPLAFAS